MGAYDKSPSLIIKDGYRPHRHGNAQALNRICGEFQPATSSPWSLVSESIQVHQDVDYILNLFGEKVPEARRLYLEFVKQGIAAGRRPDLTGEG